jgi:hypothetical protein
MNPSTQRTAIHYLCPLLALLLFACCLPASTVKSGTTSQLEATLPNGQTTHLFECCKITLP